MKLFSFFYRKSEKGSFDIYDCSKRLVLGINSVFSRCHSGILPLYALWVILGLIVIVVILLI